MINGTYGAKGRPYIQGRLLIPRLQIDGYLDLLVDTGADSTTVHSDDAIQLSIPFDQLRNKADIGGIGGTQTYYHETALLVFVDGRRLRVYRTYLSIEDGKEQESLPSLLGRDILNHWYMRYDPTNDLLGFVVRHADLTIPPT